MLCVSSPSEARRVSPLDDTKTIININKILINIMDIIEIESLVDQLEVGQSIHIVCPTCNAIHERSFRVKHYEDGTIYGRCYRATCPSKGITFRRGLINLRPEKVKQSFDARLYDRIHQLEELPSQVKYGLLKDNSLTEQELAREGVLWDSERSLLWFDVYDKHGQAYGGMTKDYYGLKQYQHEKWMTHFTRKTNRLHFPKGFRFSTRYNIICIVEDIISGIRLNRYMKTVPILGTHLNDEQALELATMGKRLFVALDPDAITKAEKIKKRYNSLFEGGVKVCTLDCDPKDFSTDNEMLNQIIIKKEEKNELREDTGEQQESPPQRVQAVY